MNKVVVIADLKLTNLGDYFIHLSLMQQLRKKGVKEVYRISDETRDSEECNYINYRNFINVSKKIALAERVFFGGGGIIQDESSFSNLFFYAFMAVLSKLLGTPYEIISVGVTEPSNVYSRWLMRVILSGANKVTVRDKESKSIVNSISSINCTVVEDLVFQFDHKFENKTDKPKKTPPFILVSPRELIEQRVSENFFNEFARQLELVSQKHSLPIYFIPFQKEKDLAVCHKLNSMVNCKSKVIEIEKDGIFELLYDAKLMIFMRLHAGIISHLMNTPVVAINYSCKVANFMRKYGLENYICEVEQISELSKKCLSLKV